MPIAIFLNDYNKAGTVATVFCVPAVDIRTCRRKSCSCLVEQRGSQRALNVSMRQLRSPFTCNRRIPGRPTIDFKTDFRSTVKRYN